MPSFCIKKSGMSINCTAVQWLPSGHQKKMIPFGHSFRVCLKYGSATSGAFLDFTGQFSLLQGSLILEGASMCLLSKVLPLKLTRGFFNAGAMSFIQHLPSHKSLTCDCVCDCPYCSRDCPDLLINT
jgi:hypothetical protein